MARFLAPTLALVLLGTASLAGCLGPKGIPMAGDALQTPIERLAGSFDAGPHRLTVSAAAGAVSTLRLDASPASLVRVEFPKGSLIFEGDRLLLLDQPGADVQAGGTLRFIAAPTAAQFNLVLRTPDAAVPLALAVPHVRGEGFVDAAHWLDSMEIVERDYPLRNAGAPNYLTFQQWAATWLSHLDYRVEVDPYGFDRFNGVTFPVPFGGRQGALSAAANVCAYKAGTLHPMEWIVFGGHYDTVETTIHGSYDNTAGALTVFELARALAPVATDRTMVFCAWGGEEDGLWGSNAFLSTLPPGVAVSLYFNFDMAGLNWPGPVGHPVPLTTISEGLGRERALPLTVRAQKDLLGYPDEAFQFKPDLFGPASDNIAFAAHGWTVVDFAAHGGGAYPWYHRVGDTLLNMTSLMYAGASSDSTSDKLSADELRQGREAMLAGFDLVLWSALYDALLVDQGELPLIEIPE